MLDTLVEEVDRATRDKFANMHARLNNLTYHIQDKANVKGQRLEYLVQQWEDFDNQFEQLKQCLFTLKQRVPNKKDGVGNKDALRKMIWDYTTVQKGKTVFKKILPSFVRHLDIAIMM